MSDQRHSLIEAIDRIYRIVPSGAWPLRVYEFLKRPKTLKFIAGFKEESGKSSDESILVLLAAIRFIELRDGAEPGAPCLLEDPSAPKNLDIFLADHQKELFDLCYTRRVQGNGFERAFPIMELLAQSHGAQSLAVIELGCAYGMIGRALCAADEAAARFDRLCEPDQQRPVSWPNVDSYLGIDLSIPETPWFLACIPFADNRRRATLFLNEIDLNKEFKLVTGSAFDFTTFPDVTDLLPRFALNAKDRLTPVVLTSFMLYQFPQDERRRLTEIIAGFAAPLGGTWVNADLTPTGGSYHFYVAQDGVERIALEDDRCRSWRSI